MKDDELRITTLKCRIERAQRRVRRYIKPGRSLADELIAERREAELRSAWTLRLCSGQARKGGRPHTSLRFADLGAVLEVVLENLRG